MNTQTNIITEFVTDLLLECGITPSAHNYLRLSSILEERVCARVFLAIIQSLTPEQAALVSRDIAAAKSDTNSVMEKILKGSPHLQVVVASALGEIHSELVNDIQKYGADAK